MPLKEYPTRQMEPFLWILLGVIFIMIIPYVISHESSSLIEKSNRALALDALAILMMLVGSAYFIMMAWLRGSSLIVYPDYIIIKEWYGRKTQVTISQPIQTGNYQLALGVNRSISFPLPSDIFLLRVGNSWVYINLHDTLDKEAEAQSWVSLLNDHKSKHD